MKKTLLITGLLLLFLFEIGRVYFIMPFPGSQKNNTIGLAYWIDSNIGWIRIVLLLLILIPVVRILRDAKIWKRISLGAILVLYGVVFYFFNFRFLADKMFYQPRIKQFTTLLENAVDSTSLVIGVQVNGEAKAFPVEIIGYHHQVTDTIGNTPVMVTYCTVCRTGRVYSPFVNGKPENFRLVGMDHFNAMFEDATTKSWWQQATGKAIIGPLKGSALREIPSTQMTLAAWASQYPNTVVLQADTNFRKQYEDLAGFDNGTIESGLEKRDSTSWNPKSWVIGISHANTTRAYDWNELVERQLIQDSLPLLPLLLALEKDSVTYHAYNRSLDGLALQFTLDAGGKFLTDNQTKSSWNLRGECIEGPNKGRTLEPVQSYQEFWHSWATFHPETSRFGSGRQE
jgi:hypothetical protein